jgi:D-alanine transaminase/branched-chain amino acid aminotransferase
MTDSYALVNDELLPASEATVRVADLALQRGYGVFDFFRCIGGKPAFLNDHLDRLYRSAATLHLALPDNRGEIVERLMRVIHKNGYDESGVRIFVTGGYSPDGYTIDRPNIIVVEGPLKHDAALAARGISMITHEHQRQLPEAKTIDYLMAIRLQPTLKARSADEVLYHVGGVIGEAPRSNFFLVTGDGVLVTPSRNILEGVTRKHLLALAGQVMAVEVRDVHTSEFSTAREAFLTSTTKRVLPVVRIDDRQVGSGKPGAVSQQLAGLFQAQIDASRA